LLHDTRARAAVDSKRPQTLIRRPPWTLLPTWANRVAATAY